MEHVPSEVDKCYICDLLGDYEGFQDMKKQFDAQHECWKKQNESKNEDISKGKLKSYENNSHGMIIDKDQGSVPNYKVFEPKQKNQERTQDVNQRKNSKLQKN